MRPENERIAEAYEKRKSSELVKKQAASPLYSQYVEAERVAFYDELLKAKFSNLSTLNFIEVGAGTGSNIAAFEKIGILRTNIHANELLPDRFIQLQQNHPDLKLYDGSAIDLNLQPEHFDIVFQSTVFTSIPNETIKHQLANKMWEITKKDGIVLWYDFMFNNPKNKDVKGISRAEIRKLFPKAKHIRFQKVTLAPPIGRRFVKLYKMLNLFPFLRTHVIAVIEK